MLSLYGTGIYALFSLISMILVMNFTAWGNIALLIISLIFGILAGGCCWAVSTTLAHSARL